MTQVTHVLRQQFGIVSAAAFPPHVTLAGFTATSAPREEIARAVEVALEDQREFVVWNAGITRSNVTIAFDVNGVPGGEVNSSLGTLAERVNDAMSPFALDFDGELGPPYSPEGFRAHISLASHDLKVREDLREEVEEFIRGLDIAYPEAFVATTVSMFEFWSDDWHSEWWHSLTWRHLRSWKLGG